MIKLTLSDRAEEIFQLLPKAYAEIILNSIIARSLESGVLIDESKTFLNNQSIQELLDNIDPENETKPKYQKQQGKKKIIKEAQITNNPENNDEVSEKEGLALFDV